MIAIARDKTVPMHNSFSDPEHIPGNFIQMYGEDITWGVGKLPAPSGYEIKFTEAEAKAKMLKLLDIFAPKDKKGMAKTLFNLFLKKQSEVTIFESPDLNDAYLKHSNINYFCNAAVGAPSLIGYTPGKFRIHQSLQKANWDIHKMSGHIELGMPALNNGNKYLQTGDFENGLGVMINSIQYVFLIATSYFYDKENSVYFLNVKFVFYDVFGLDNDDLIEFGAKKYSAERLSDAFEGISAWWHLQHRFNYAPIVTRAIVERSFVVPTGEYKGS